MATKRLITNIVATVILKKNGEVFHLIREARQKCTYIISRGRTGLDHSRDIALLSLQRIASARADSRKIM